MIVESMIVTLFAGALLYDFMGVSEPVAPLVDVDRNRAGALLHAIGVRHHPVSRPLSACGDT